MNKFVLSLLALVLVLPENLLSEETEKTVSFGLDPAAASKNFLPDRTDLGLTASSFENTPSANRNAFDLSESERQTTKEQREYEHARAAIEQERVAAKHREEVAAQSQAFSREFLAMNLYDREFPERFAEILEKYPLAGEEEFCARLIEKGRRIQAVAQARAVSKEEPPIEGQDPTE
ncbi:MAG: hypothetical protein WEB60_00775 [Terrimicrobiaceae bacterium]